VPIVVTPGQLTVEKLITVPSGSVGNKLTVVVAICIVSACDTAVTVTVPEVGGVAGAM